jgi:hypothetical protein
MDNLEVWKAVVGLVLFTVFYIYIETVIIKGGKR